MTNLTESSVWESGVFQLETDTPTLGGVPGFDAGVPVTGHANAQALQLANRTKWLNDNKVNLSDLADATDPAKGAAMIGRGWQAASSIAQLRTLKKDAPSKYAEVFGYYSAGDGGGGLYYLDSSDTTSADNGGTVIVSADGGRWKLNHRGVITVMQFGARGNGADDYAAFAAAIAANAGGTVYVPEPPSEYVIGTGKLTIPANTILAGATRHVTPIRHAYNGDMFELGDGAGLENLWLKGDGASYTGRCMYFAGSAGRQSVKGVRASDWDGEVQFYDVAAGSQCVNSDIRFSRRSAGTGTDRYAVVISPTQQLSAVPRKFSNVETDGTCSFDFGGCNNVQVVGGFVGDLKYRPDSRAVALSGLRIANQLSLTIDGHNNTASACDFSPQLTFASGTDANAFQGCTYNNLPIINNSGNGRNLMDHWSVAYTPTLTSGGTSPTLGDGVITASFSCSGNVIFVDIQFTIGSTTNLGTGELRFSLPAEQPNTNSILQCVGAAVLLRGSTNHTAVMQIPAATQYVRMIRDTSGSVTFNSPATWAAGDIFRLSFAYKK